jgi:uncharacterized repeat protein (TIGR02543 family)
LGTTSWWGEADLQVRLPAGREQITQNIDVLVRVADSAQNGSMPDTGDGSALLLCIAALICLVFGAALLLFCRRNAQRRAPLPIFVATLFLAAVGLGASSVLVTGAFADENTHTLVVTKDANSSTQSTLAVPIPLPPDAIHGTSVFINCTKNEFGDISADISSPVALRDSTAGFALIQNVTANPKNTVLNNFDATYSTQENQTKDTHRFAALPKTSQLIWQSTTSEASECVIYLSARVASSLPTGDYRISLAVDVRKTIVVTYSANGGTDTFSEYATEGPVALSEPEALSRVGYRFASYNTAADGTGTSYAPGDVITLHDDVILYAQWIATTYTVDFDLNSGTGTTPSNIEVAHDGTYSNLPDDTGFSRTGYTFTGWSTDATGGTPITAATIVAITEPQTLYAQWAPNTYAVNFNANGGTAPIPTNKQVIYANTYGDLASTTRTGYTFDGWFTDATGGAPITTTTRVAITDTQTLFAHWSAATYTLDFDANGGAAPTPTTKQVTYAGIYGDLASTTRTGYTFDGWFTDATGGTQVITTTPVAITDTQTLYAHWTVSTTAITLNANGGSANDSLTVTYGSTALTAFTAPMRTDYALAGYFTAALGGIKIIDENGALVSGVSGYTNASGAWERDVEELTLYAHWDTATLSFEVRVASNDSFAIPTSGHSVGGGVAGYAWDIDWGDGTTEMNKVGTSRGSSASPGISHTYASAGTYTITIRPSDTSAPFQWARAFGFSLSSSGSSAAENKEKVISVIAMSAKGFLESATSTGYGFLDSTWAECTNLTTAVVPDTSNWDVTTVGDNFLYSTWAGCTNLTTAVVPNTSNWDVTTIGDFFLYATWLKCSSLTVAVVPDTSSWEVNSIDFAFMVGTWLRCSSLTVAVVPDTSSWEVNSIGFAFLQQTWDSCSSLTVAVVPDTSSWEVTSIDYGFLYATWHDCSSLTVAVVPDTSSWEVTSIGDGFLAAAWSGCTSLTTAVVPDTSNWNSTVGDDFLSSTWAGCTSLTTAVVPDTSNWDVTTVGEYFLAAAWHNCTNLATAVVPDTSNWDVTTVGDGFLNYTWLNCPSLKDLSGIKFSDSFKTADNLYSGNYSWSLTFALESDPGDTIGAQPSFYTLGPITAGGTPANDCDVFQNRTGMDGYDSLSDGWK